MFKYNLVIAFNRRLGLYIDLPLCLALIYFFLCQSLLLFHSHHLTPTTILS